MMAIDRSLVAALPLFAGLAPDEFDQTLREAHATHHPKTALSSSRAASSLLFVLLPATCARPKPRPSGQQVLVRYASSGKMSCVVESHRTGRTSGVFRHRDRFSDQLARHCRDDGNEAAHGEPHPRRPGRLRTDRRRPPANRLARPGADAILPPYNYGGRNQRITDNYGGKTASYGFEFDAAQRSIEPPPA